MSKSGLWTVFLLLIAGVGSSHAESIRVNVGGDTYTDVSGNLWSADRGCNTGILNTISGPVQGTPDEFLFLTTRWDDAAAPEMTCSYAVSPGLYKVTLYFTESNSRNFKNGARVFDVLIEGLLEFDNLDIYREAGANTALLKTTTVNVTDGRVNIKFRHQVKNPLIKAIAIVPAGNSPPVINTAPVKTAAVDAAYSYDVNVSDDAGDTQQYFLDVAPGSMSINRNSGVISWTPGSADEGSHAVTVRVRDQGGLEDTQSYTLTVGSTVQQSVRVNIGGGAYTDSAGNLWSADSGCNTGIVSTVPGPIQGTVDEPLLLTARWDDAPAPEMTCSYAVSPGLYEVTLYFTESNSRNFKNGARVFDVLIEGLLEFDNLDIYREAGANTALLKTTTVNVTDGRVNIKFRHQVKNPLIKAIAIVPAGNSPPVINTAPVISTAPVTTVTAGGAYSYDVNVSDDAGDTQQYFLDVAPGSMSINRNSGVISWAPGSADVGPHAVTVRVRDQGGLEDTQSYTLTVSAAVGNNPPLISTTPVTTVTAGGAYSYDVNVTDDVGDTQQYFLDVAPGSMGINRNSGVISCEAAHEKRPI